MPVQCQYGYMSVQNCKYCQIGLTLIILIKIIFIIAQNNAYKKLKNFVILVSFKLVTAVKYTTKVFNTRANENLILFTFDLKPSSCT